MMHSASPRLASPRPTPAAGHAAPARRRQRMPRTQPSVTRRQGTPDAPRGERREGYVPQHGLGDL